MIEVRRNEDGSLDEIVGTGFVHLEQMDSGHWWLRIDSKDGSVVVHLTARGKISALVEQEPSTEGM